MKKKFNAGFTFIELLIALTIFSIIAASIYYTLNAGIKVWQRGNILIRENQRMRIFFDAMSKDMRNAVPFSGIPSQWTENSVTFHTIIDTFSSEPPHRKLVRRIYYFDDKKGELKRARVIQKEGFDEKYVDEEVLLDNLEDVGFEYAYESGEEYEWKDEWEFGDEDEGEDIIPRGVKIRVELKGKDDEKAEIFEKIVLIPIGKLGSEELTELSGKE